MSTLRRRICVTQCNGRQDEIRCLSEVLVVTTSISHQQKIQFPYRFMMVSKDPKSHIESNWSGSSHTGKWPVFLDADINSTAKGNNGYNRQQLLLQDLLQTWDAKNFTSPFVNVPLHLEIQVGNT